VRARRAMRGGISMTDEFDIGFIKRSAVMNRRSVT
jgi:hypothetical protein